MENKQKYVIITPFFPSSETHMGSYVYDQAKTIANFKKYDVSVVKITSFFSNETDYVFEGIQVKIFKVFDFPFFIFPGIFNWLNSIRIKQFFHAEKLMKNLVVIHTHVCYPSAYLAIAIASITKVKTIVQHHGIDALQLLNGRFNIITKLQKNFLKSRSIKQLNKIGLSLSVSRCVQSALHNFNSYNPKDEYVLYNGVDREKFFPIENFKKSEKYSIGCIANFWPIKDHISLIKAIELLVKDGIKDIDLRLIGSGEKLADCQRYVKENNLSSFVIFEKERAHTEINKFYNEIDLFVLSSYFEASACVLMEAWATDTPILSIKKQGIAELIPKHEVNNLLVNEKSPALLKEKILGEYQRKRKYPFDEKYDIKNIISEFLNYNFFKRNV